jgi:hypothetical protein
MYGRVFNFFPKFTQFINKSLILCNLRWSNFKIRKNTLINKISQPTDFKNYTNIPICIKSQYLTIIPKILAKLRWFSTSYKEFSEDHIHVLGITRTAEGP